MSNIVLTDRPRTGESVLRLKKIPNFENYLINELGEIYNAKTYKKLKTHIGVDNYEHCTLYRNGRKYRKRVHRLMGKTFLGNPEVVNHIDGNKGNNKLSNLERSTHSENIKHAYDNNMYKSTNSVKVIITDKTTGDKKVVKSMREAERFTGIDRHRIKTFILDTVKNYSNWNFEYFE